MSKLLRDALEYQIEMWMNVPMGIDEDADEMNRSPSDAVAHMGGLAVKNARKVLEQDLKDKSPDDISAKDVQNAMLKSENERLKEEINQLNIRIENVTYYTTLSYDLVEKSRKAIISALRGELGRPTLRLNEDK